ncbi:hypothetical protein REPUB_Repub12eG0155200 [Reevesia pubescens]
MTRAFPHHHTSRFHLINPPISNETSTTSIFLSAPCPRWGFIEIKKLGGNSSRIRSKIGIEASLDTVWNILTDYEKLAVVIPALAVSKVVEKKDKFARLYQIGQQNLPLGMEFNAKGVIDCFEKDLEILPSGKKCEIQFKMVEAGSRGIAIKNELAAIYDLRHNIEVVETILLLPSSLKNSSQ